MTATVAKGTFGIDPCSKKASEELEEAKAGLVAGRGDQVGEGQNPSNGG